MWVPILLFLCLVAFSYAHSDTKEVGFVTGWLTFFKENPVISGIGAVLACIGWELFNVMMKARGQGRFYNLGPSMTRQPTAFIEVGGRTVALFGDVKTKITNRVARDILKGHLAPTPAEIARWARETHR